MSVPRPKASTIPDEPGAYLFRDGDGRVVYVGKAGSLRKRLASYWGRPLHPRTEAMVAAAESVEWIVARTELDALMLEYNLIKEHRPRFNIRYRDDKSYPYLAITTGEEWPRAQVLRGRKRKNVRYFGPYGHAYAIRETLDSLTRVFPVRTCSNSFFDQRARAKRPCLYYDIGRCSGPCVPEVTGVTQERYRADVEDMSDFLAGNQKEVLDFLQAEMADAAAGQEYELAAKTRDRLAAARRAMETQEMVLTQREDLDVIALVEDDLEAAFQVFFVRRGRVTGRKGWIVDRVEELDRPSLLASFLRELYMERDEVPPRVLVAEPPADQEILLAWLTEMRGGPVRFAVPERGPKRKLLEVVSRNAEQAFQRHKLRRSSDFGARSRALSQLAEELGLEQAPLRIECYDISNLGPTDTVGSMVVFEDGLPKRSDYRKFEIKGVAGTGRFREHGGDASQAIRPAAARLRGRRRVVRHGPRRARWRPPQAPAVRVSAGSDRGRRWPRPARRRDDRAAGGRPRHPRDRAGEAPRGGVRPGRARATEDPADVGGPVRPSASARRGAPVRDHLPPAEARQAGAGVAAGRHPRRRAELASAPCFGGSVRSRGFARRARRRSPARPASARASPPRSTSDFTPSRTVQRRDDEASEPAERRASA